MRPATGLIEDSVADRLIIDGIARASLGSIAAFVRTCGNLGHILSSTDVSPLPSTRGDVSISDPIPFHSDGASADVVAWFCIRQDEGRGESMLIDTIPLLQALAPKHRTHLLSVEVYDYDGDRGERDSYCPLLRGNDETDWRVNYTPWILPEMSRDQEAAVAAFDDLLRAAEATIFRLAPGEALFVDNWRILHGRGPLRSDSPRQLKRVWLRTSRTSRRDRIVPGHERLPSDDTL